MIIKKLTLIVFLVSSFCMIKAQETIKENKMILGGSFSFLTQNNTYPYSSLSVISGIGGIFSSSTNDTKNSIFAITPYFGKEINSNLILGLQLDYRIGTYSVDDQLIFGQTDPVDFERNSSQLGFGIFSRHILNPDKKFSLFLQPYIEYNILKEEESWDSVVNQEEKANYLELGVGLGILYNINDGLRATLSVGGMNYINGQWEIVDSDTENNFSSFRTGLNLSNINFGFEMKL